jgi:hypothetical protein
MADRGIVYVATKYDRYLEEAFLSANSVKERFPDLSITLFTDLPRHPLCATGRFDSIETIQGVSGFGSNWAEGLLNRVRCLPRTPYDRTLHIDTDTRVLTEELLWLFDLLEQIDIAMVETSTDDSYSRKHFGRPMFNGGLMLYRRNERVWALLEEWAARSERNFQLAGQKPLPPVPALQHIADEDIRRKLLFNDQISLVEILSPEINKFDLALKTLDYSWNNRSSRQPEKNRAPVKILHAPALKNLTHADILDVAFRWKRDGRTVQAKTLYNYIDGKYPDTRPAPLRVVGGPAPAVGRTPTSGISDPSSRS